LRANRIGAPAPFDAPVERLEAGHTTLAVAF